MMAVKNYNIYILLDICNICPIPQEHVKYLANYYGAESQFLAGELLKKNYSPTIRNHVTVYNANLYIPYEIMWCFSCFIHLKNSTTFLLERFI